MSKPSLLALLLGLLAMAASLYLSRTTFDRLPHLEDEYAYAYQAQIFARGDVTLDTPQPRRAFWQPFLIDYQGQRFGKYPPGWPLMQAVGYWLGWPAVINAWLAMLAVLLTYRLGRAIYDPAVGVMAATLLAASPIALLHNATLMPHPAALCLTLLVLYGLWRLEGSRPGWWSVAVGVALGLLVAVRPLVAGSVGLPLVAYSGLRLGMALVPASWRTYFCDPAAPWLRRLLIRWLPLLALTGAAFWASTRLTIWPNWPVLALGAALLIAAMAAVVFEQERARVNPPWPDDFRATFKPLLVVAGCTVLVGALWPLYNWAATGDPARNLYTFVWEYDTPGFGPEHGRYGHDWDNAQANLATDMHCFSRDLSGWVAQPDNPPAEIIRPSGDDRYGNLCVTDRAGLSWLLLPLGLVVGWRRRWTFLLALVAAGVVGGTLFYWIGAAVYSARYYYAAVGVLAILSAAGLGGLVNLLRRWRIETAVYALGVAITLMVVAGYVERRLAPLEREYTIPARQQLQTVQALRQHPDRPLLVITYGDIHWRQINALMAHTSPYLDSDIVLARDPEKTYLPVLLARFPKREVLYYYDGRFTATPPPSATPPFG